MQDPDGGGILGGEPTPRLVQYGLWADACFLPLITSLKASSLISLLSLLSQEGAALLLGVELKSVRRVMTRELIDDNRGHELLMLLVSLSIFSVLLHEHRYLFLIASSNQTCLFS